MKTFAWLVRREFWEHRGGFLRAPLITALIFLLLNLMGIVTGEVLRVQHGIQIGWDQSRNIELFNRAMSAGDMTRVGQGLDLMMLSTSMIISTVLGFVVFFYCLGALYDDRRDRSLLFWKSLPVSDTATVLSKVVAALVLAPAIAAVCGVVSGFLMLLLYAVTLSFHGVNVWYLLTLGHPLRVAGSLIGSIPVYVAWALPTAGWLLLCSAWARTKPFLWAVTLPVAIGVVVTWFQVLGGLSGNLWYWKDIAGRFLLGVFPGGWLWFSRNGNLDIGDFSNGDVLQLGHSYGVLASPSLWIAALVGLAMIAGAIWVRRWRDDT